MKKLLLIIPFILLGNIWQVFAQESELNKLEQFKSIKLTDTLWIDIKKGGCFHGSWNKLIIVKVKEEIQLIKINDVARFVLKYDKKAVLYNAEEEWIRKNLRKIKEAENVLNISREEYIQTIDKIINLISISENSASRFSGEWSSITLSMNDLKMYLTL
ncbi:hypothetical protein SAMN05216480_1067 [Pustulibacterium marinum]|uniref:Uncharacterized protein n=1 Tax=Pustulibacterium marinum TaxID=1224947 RepID=A0A1I7GV82_9FLAO|nr:hypothetical protein [Pustulibacterium marinum]SFU52321.1 hypothetical protein SAMN05216480_1067 [Pustulibacterium marinum]